MTTQFYSLITKYGESVIAQAVANNTPVPLKTMAIGDGNGTPTTPSESQTTLINEVYRAEITDLLQDSETPNQVIAELLVPETVGGFTVREVGIYDDQNKLVAVANCPENYKPVLEQGSGKVQYYRIVLRVSSSDSVTLSLNNNIVYATRLEFNRFVNDLSKPDGFKLVGECESITQLRTIEPTEDQQRILVKSYHARKNLGGGVFYADFADKTTTDNGVTVFVTTGGKRWKRVYSTLNIFDFGVSLDSVNNDAIKRLQAWQEPVLGLGNVIPASSRIVPASHISQVAYRFNGIDYLSEDYYKTDLSQITRTGYYTAWTQDKAFVHNGVIYAPFMLACRHGYDDLRIAWVRSFDNGNTWTTPEILMDYHPQNPTLGWHCFSMGIVGNRLFMLVEERDVASKKMVRSFLYSRVMTKNFFVTGGISQSGNVVTVELEEHGLFVGDSISFSNSGISGVSGKMTVTSVLDANRFTVMNSKEQTITNNDSWLCATYFEDNQWQIQELSTFANSAGVAATHLHSFCPVNRSQFAFGFHNGDASPREIGFVKCSINWATGRVTTDKIILSETLSRAAAEPCLRYYKNKLFLTTRSQNPNVGSLLIRCDLNGENISSFNISTEKIHYTNMPFHIENDVIYMFAAERAENEWETGQSDKSGNRYRANRPRMFLLKHRLSDWGKPEKTEVQVISQGIYSGESANSACGVGSIVYKDGILHCLFGDEDYRNSHSLTENARKANNAHIDSGYQPEIYSLRIVIDKQMAGVTDKPLRGADNLHLPVFRGTDGVRTVQSPVRFSEKVEFDNAVALAVATVGRILASSKAGADYAMYGTDYLNNANRLYLSSTHQANSQNGSTITLHNDKSEEGSIIDYRATAHKFLGGVHINTGVINTPPESAGHTEIVNAKWVNSQIEKNNTEKVLFSGSTQEPVSVQVSSLRGEIHVLASIRGVKRWDSFSLWSSNNTYIGASEYGGENADRDYGSLIRVNINDRTLTLTPTSTYLPTIKKIIHLGA